MAGDEKLAFDIIFFTENQNQNYPDYPGIRLVKNHLSKVISGETISEAIGKIGKERLARLAYSI